MRNPFRRRTENRDLTSVPWDVGGPSTVSVNQDKALGLAPVYAAARHVADTISTLPLQPFRKVDQSRRPMASLPVLFRLLDEDGSLNDWVFEACTSLALAGNAVGLVTGRDGMGFPTAIHWLPMHEVHVDDQNPVRPVWHWRGRRLDSSEIVHVPWFKLPGRTLGLSPIEAFALTISSGIQAQQYGNDWFAAGGVPPGKMKNSAKKIKQGDADEIKARLVTAIRSRKPLVYGADWDYEPIVIPPEQAQFIQTMKLTAGQVASAYGISPEEIGGEAGNSLTYANEEARQIRRLQDLRPWLVRLERKFSSWLPERQYVRFNADATVRADLQSRHEVYRIAREIGLLSIDEIRALEDRPPIPDGKGADHAPLSARPSPAEPRVLPALPRELPAGPVRVNGHTPDRATVN
jgi:HK97 family phage portal protein